VVEHLLCKCKALSSKSQSYKTNLEKHETIYVSELLNIECNKVPETLFILGPQ
jgi:hypothetical protein